MSYGNNQADRQASPRIPSSQTICSLLIDLSTRQKTRTDTPRTSSPRYSVACLTYLHSPSPAHAVFHSAPTDTDGSVIRPSRRSGTPESGLDWTEASLLRRIRILIPFRFGSLAALVIVAITNKLQKGPGPSSRWLHLSLS